LFYNSYLQFLFVNLGLITQPSLMTIDLVKTDDGSDTLFVRELGEHYHSTYGAVQESRHVFIGSGLRVIDMPSLKVFEVGFGSGLNAFLTFIESLNTGQTIHYIAIEKWPVPRNIWEMLNYSKLLSQDGKEAFRTMHLCPWNEKVNISENFSLTKILGDITSFDFDLQPVFDLIYFDAFSPEKQPELWGRNIFEKLYENTAPFGKLVTYCSKGSVRRALQASGYITERLPGPPGKREILRASKFLP
jgi:tRNA U34 5-methylaminomethyl-2-thiouridine-forming methyltransferase MnmC